MATNEQDNASGTTIGMADDGNSKMTEMMMTVTVAKQ